MTGDDPMRVDWRAELGVERVIHAGGTKTWYGGTVLDPEVRAAMHEASQHFCNVAALNERVGRYVAQTTDAEAGIVTNGCASAVALASMACMGIPAPTVDRGWQRPPRDEFVVQRHHRGQYNFLLGSAGGRIREVGDPAGCADEAIAEAIRPSTAAVYVLFGPGIDNEPRVLERVASIAHAHGVPVLVNAAAMLPPRRNLTRFIDEGADLVCMSGGKVLGGPQDTGLLFGRADLVRAAFEHLSPHMSFGRAHKIAKEDLVGLYVALRRYETIDEAEVEACLRARLERIHRSLVLPGAVTATIERDDYLYFVPTLVLQLERSWRGPDAGTLVDRLLAADPPLFVRHDRARRRLEINPLTLANEEEPIVADVVGRVLGAAAATPDPLTAETGGHDACET